MIPSNIYDGTFLRNYHLAALIRKLINKHKDSSAGISEILLNSCMMENSGRLLQTLFM